MCRCFDPRIRFSISFGSLIGNPQSLLHFLRICFPSCSLSLSFGSPDAILPGPGALRPVCRRSLSLLLTCSPTLSSVPKILSATRVSMKKKSCSSLLALLRSETLFLSFSLFRGKLLVMLRGIRSDLGSLLQNCINSSRAALVNEVANAIKVSRTPYCLGDL